MKKKAKAPEKINENIYWLGSTDSSNFLQVNVYLYKKGNKAILIDPGPVSVFRQIFSAYRETCEVNELEAIIVSHQDPDICASIPLWEENGFRGPVIAHWRTALLLPAYGIKSQIHSINESQSYSITGMDNIKFLGTPYLHSPGTIVTFDEENKVLFSGDLFGALGLNIELYADESYIKRMIVFHEQYMPSTSILMSALDRIEELFPSMICPQHGSIIRGNPADYISGLREAECGKMNPSGLAAELINASEMKELKKLNFELQENLILVNDDKLRDSVSGLYNGIYLQSLLPSYGESNPEGSIVYFRIDAMKSFNSDFGFAEGDRAIAAFSKILIENKPETTLLFRDSGPVFTLLFADHPEPEIRSIIREIQEKVEDSVSFLRTTSCSAAVIRISELNADSSVPADEQLRILVRTRMKTLDKMGPSSICLSSEKQQLSIDRSAAVLIEPDPASAELITEFLESRDFDVVLCREGSKALHIIDLNRPGVIISELNVPQYDGFRIRKRLLETEDLKGIPFILISHQKNETSLSRAHKLKITHYLKKPFMMQELYGLAKLLSESTDEY